MADGGLGEGAGAKGAREPEAVGPPESEAEPDRIVYRCTNAVDHRQPGAHVPEHVEAFGYGRIGLRRGGLQGGEAEAEALPDEGRESGAVALRKGMPDS